MKVRDSRDKVGDVDVCDTVSTVHYVFLLDGNEVLGDVARVEAIEEAEQEI